MFGPVVVPIESDNAFMEPINVCACNMCNDDDDIQIIYVKKECDDIHPYTDLSKL